MSASACLADDTLMKAKSSGIKAGGADSGSSSKTDGS